MGIVDATSICHATKNDKSMFTLEVKKQLNEIRLPHLIAVAVLSIVIMGTSTAYHYAHQDRYDDEGRKLLPDPQSPCEAAQKTAVENCREQLEEAWFDTGAHYYTQAQMKRDLPICRKMGDAVYGSCNSYGK